MDELDLLFKDLSPEEAEALLTGIEIQQDKELSTKIKNSLGLKKKNELKPFPFKKTISLAAAVFAVILCSAFGLKFYNSLKPEPTTTTLPTTTESQSLFSKDILMAAISKGDNSLIEKIAQLAPSVFSDEVISFAVECVQFISYETLHHVAQAAVNYRGTTGLDSLLESTLLGDSKRALEELKKRENLLMTPLEKLAFFFSVAFCDSEVVKSFIEAGYDISEKDLNGNTLYEIAEQYNNQENMQYLINNQ